MILDNTRMISGMQSEQPMSFLRRAGLAAISDELNGMGVADDTVTKANAELFYLTNLWRGVQGQDALPPSAGPTVNVGISPEMQKMAMYGFGALLVGGLLLSRK